MGGLTRFLTAVGAALVVTGGIGGTAPASGAQEPWLPLKRLSLTGLSAGGPQIAVGPDGTTTAIWTRFETDPDDRFYYQDLKAPAVVQASTRRPGGRFSAPVNVSDGAQDAGGGPQMAVGADGTTSAAWTQYDGRTFVVWASTRPPHGSFAPPVRVSPADELASAQQVSVAPDGTTTVVWLVRSAGTSGIGYEHSTVQASTRRPGGTFSPPVDLGAGDDLGGLRVAVAENGATTVIWSRGNGPGSAVEATTRHPGGTFGPPVDLSAPGETARDPALAVGVDGTTTVVWSGSVPSPLNNQVVRARTRRPRGTFGPPVNLSLPKRAELDVQPDIAVEPNGTTTVVWWRADGGTLSVQATTRRPGSTFGAPVDVSGRIALHLQLGAGAGPRLAVGADGTATVVWIAPLSGYRLIVRASNRPPGKRFGAPVNLSRPRVSAVAGPQVAVGPDGRATAVWPWPDARNHPQVEAAVTAHPPVVRRAAAISGMARLGRTLRCRPASFTGATRRSTIWLRVGKPIKGANKTTHTIGPRDLGKLIACRTVATGPEGTATSTSRGTLARP